MKLTLKSILLIVGVLSCYSLYANESEDTLRILFRQGRSRLDENIKGNKSSLNMLDSLLNDSSRQIRRIDIIGSASPEGRVALNNVLSDKRAEKILTFLESTNVTDGSSLNIRFTGRDWGGLYNAVCSDNNVPYREDVLILLNEIVANQNNGKIESESDHYLEKLKNIKGGIPYRYMYSRLFPKLRASNVVLDFYNDIEFNEIPGVPSIETPPITERIIFSYIPSAKKVRSNFYMALKTNLLYDALALPSLSAEFYLGKNFSAVANWTYGWWDNDHRHRYWRAYGGDLAVRWWFGKKAHIKPLTGHHIGIYGGIFTYDFEFGGKGYMGGLPGHTLWNRSLRMAGVEYGYSLPVAKRFNIDFTIGIGYLGGKYLKYIPSDGRYLWQSTHRINWFGPTKAEISLVWLLGRGNVNPSKKGGKL